MELTSEKKAALLKAQQGEMNGVETYTSPKRRGRYDCHIRRSGY